MSPVEVSSEEVEKTFQKFYADAEKSGYHLNPDPEFTKRVVKGLLVNEKRYGYMSCPCRLSSRILDMDRDIICPCDYRDADISDFGACYCGLYVSDNIFKGEQKVTPIPERRPAFELRKKEPAVNISVPLTGTSLPYPIWRCRVCGYICARDAPPEICPICKAKKDRFEKFI
jgi:ferredoxin-thioredoxin reductase catalytic subunit